ncbi:GNAT family N-acetyltransferase [Desulfatitalea tepidiphila]|uniref:GNAT family N-acetyltransferase n=1 Tax=Desulfatitalea tepidiphila TaxID=1185843 RepID=UPI00128EBE29|nr:GNAT family N-acetyltransferase [Desulfatitalea tepidiphila]
MQDDAKWDQYVAGHPMSHAYLTSHWQKIITSAYGYTSYALAAVSNDPHPAPGQVESNLKGLLPLVHLRSPLFGNRLVSMPYFDHGGILSDTEETERQLIQAAVRLGQTLRVKRIELRQLYKLNTLENGVASATNHPVSWGKFINAPADGQMPPEASWTLKCHKARMVLHLPRSAEELMKSFKSKLRSQINRATKAGLRASVGGVELFGDFYHVFSNNMRDLGSPVHNKALPRSVMDYLPNQAWIVVVYKADTPVAASLMAGFKDVMINPWASALREFSKDSPNMLLYWHMLEFAADKGYRFFDFGRSTPGEGTYRFKTQWGAQPQPMYWYTIWLDEGKMHQSGPLEQENGKRREMVASLWSRLPVAISRIVGPMIRKHIDL